jgi:hypothetical protein
MTNNQSESRPFPWPLVLIGAGVLLIGVTLGYGVVYNSPSPTPTPTAWVMPQIERISAEEAFQASKSGNTVIIDVRDSVSFETSHIAGAILIPADQYCT